MLIHFKSSTPFKIQIPRFVNITFYLGINWDSQPFPPYKYPIYPTPLPSNETHLPDLQSLLKRPLPENFCSPNSSSKARFRDPGRRTAAFLKTQKRRQSLCRSISGARGRSGATDSISLFLCPLQDRIFFPPRIPGAVSISISLFYCFDLNL